MSGSASINPRQLGVSNGAIPTASRVYSFSVLLTSGAETIIDLRPYVYKNVIKQVQGVYIDNSDNTTSTTLSVIGGQNITIAPQSQGVFPLYLSDDYTLTLSGSGTVTLVLLNFPTPAATWSVVPPAALPISGGKMLVSDPTLEALIANGAYQANPTFYGSGDILVHGRAGNAYSGTLATASTTTIIAGSPSAFITDYDLTLSPNATLATAGMITVTLAFATAGQIISRQLYVSGAAANGPPTPIGKLSGLNLIGSLADDSVTLTLSTALATGAVEYTIIGGTTAVA